MGAMQYAGIVNIPLFDSQTNVADIGGGALNFSPFSDYPLIKEAVWSNVSGVISALQSFVPCPVVASKKAILSEYFFNNGQVTQNSVANYVDELITYTQAGASGSILVFVKPQPHLPGNWSSPNIGYYSFTPTTIKSAGGTVSGGALLNNGQLTKGNYLGQPCLMGIIAPGTGVTDTFVPAPIYMGIGGTVHDANKDFGGLNTTNDYASTWASSRLTPAPGQPFDNVICQLNTNSNPGVHSLTFWSSLNSNFQVTPITINDTGLPGGLAALFNTTQVATWAHGFLVIVQTNGAGPTKQQFEIIMFDNLGTKWWLINLQPQDHNSGIAINTATSTGWQFTVDPNGIAWFNPGTAFGANYLGYSFSPLSFSIPWIFPQLLNPITLPCYNVCDPVSYACPDETPEPVSANV